MPRRQLHRVTLPRSPRGLSRTVPRQWHGWARAAKVAAKRATMRDCNRRCVYCGTCLDFDTATLDHVYPRARGGTGAPGNLVTACRACNQLKGDLLPVEFFLLHPWAGENFVRYARAVHRALKRNARRAVSLAYAA